MPPTDQALIKLVGEFGYHTDSGMCSGYSVMGMQAMLASDLKTFKERMKFIEGQLRITRKDFENLNVKVLQPKDVDALTSQKAKVLAERIKAFEAKQVATIAALKQELLKSLGVADQVTLESFDEFLKVYKAKKDPAANALIKAYESQRSELNLALNPEEHILREIHPFLEVLALYFAPQLSPDIFSKDATPNFQNTTLALIRGLPDSLIDIIHPVEEEKKSENHNILAQQQEEALVKKVNSFLGAYKIEELTKLFQLLGPDTSPVFDPPVSFLLFGGDHSISVVYDKDEKCWQLFDLSKFPIVSCKTDSEIAKEVLTSFSTNGIASFVAEVYCTKDKRELVNTWLTSQMEKEEWINMHKMAGKENWSDSFGFTLLHNAAISNDIKSTKDLLACLDNPNNQSIEEKWTPLHIYKKRHFSIRMDRF